MGARRCSADVRGSSPSPARPFPPAHAVPIAVIRLFAGSGGSILAATPRPALEGAMISERFSHYQILRELGKGGMGEVFLARDTSLNREVALKFLPPEFDQDATARKRLLREARAAAALDHPFICHIHEVGEIEGKPFIAMEYVEGQTLKERICRRPLDPAEALPVAVEIAEALQTAHEHGVIHRDLKPANVMLTPGGHVKVMDFGLAKQGAGTTAGQGEEATVSELTAEGFAVGTPAYMSPEQLFGRPADARSDIFSLGILLFELLSGRHPFRKQSALETAAAIVSEKPPGLSQFRSDIPAELEAAVARMLAKEPDKRQQSMADVLAELRGIPHRQEESAAGATAAAARRRLAAAVLVALACAAAWYIGQHWPRSAAAALAFEERDWILVTDFENQTGEDIFTGSLETAMTVSLQQSRYVNVFPRARIQDVLRRMRKENISRLDEPLGREVALREGIKGLLACSIGKVGSEYLLAARLVDPATMVTVYSRSFRARGPDRVLEAVDELAGRIREELGESLANISDRRVPLYQATTVSLEALKAYTDSRQAGGRSRLQLLERAIQLDPDFALAHAQLGMNYYMANERPRGEEHFQKALGLLDRLTLREQLWIRAVVDDWRGNRDQGIENYRIYLHQYPDDATAWFRLGWACMITNRDTAAVEAFQKVIAIDPSESGALINLATCYSSMGRDAEAVATYEKAFQIDPEGITGLFVNSEYGFLLARNGRIREAEDTFRKMFAVDDLARKARGHRSLGLLCEYQGKYSAAIREFAEAVLLDQTSGEKLSEMRDRQFLAAALATVGRMRDFERELAAVRRIQKEIRVAPNFLYDTGRICARTGKVAEAERLLAELKSRMGDAQASSGVNRSDTSDRACFYLLRAEIALARKRPGEALEYAEQARSLGEERARELLAYTRLASGDLQGAAAAYRSFLEKPELGYELQEPWILAHLRLAELFERMGKRQEAAGYYEKLVELWRDGDEDLAPLRQARLRLATLRGTAIR